MTTIPSQVAWESLQISVKAKVPNDLLTLLEVDWHEHFVRRRFSSDERSYPSGGVKRLMDSTWARHVLQEGRVLITAGIDEMRTAFADHELLFSLGLYNSLNIPVVVGERVEWTLNLLRAKPAFSEADSAEVLELIDSCM